MTQTGTTRISVERDAAGLEEACRDLFEETLIRRGLEREASRISDEAERERRVAEQMPRRTLSPGYYARAVYLMEVDETLQLGIPLAAESFTQADIVGIAALRRARAGFNREHPACPRCGERQDNAHTLECPFCAYQFRRRAA